MSCVYVVMKDTTSQIYLNYSRPDAVFLRRKDAVEYCDEKNRKSSSLVYYVHKAKMMDEVK